MDLSQSDSFQSQIKERLQKTKDDVSATLELMLGLQKKISAKKADAGPKPRQSKEELETKIKDIEFEMMTNNLSKQKEEEKMRTIFSIRKEIQKFGAFEEIDDLQYQRKVTQERLDLQRKAVKELSSGLRKLEVIQKVFRQTREQIPLKDVTEKDLALQDSVVGDFIGFKGQNIRSLCRVAL